MHTYHVASILYSKVTFNKDDGVEFRADARSCSGIGIISGIDPYRTVLDLGATEVASSVWNAGDSHHG